MPDTDPAGGLLAAVFCRASTALFVLDERQQCVYMNPAAEELTGFPLAEVKGRMLHDVIHHTRPGGGRYPLEACPIAGAFAANQRTQGEEVFVRKDGTYLPVAYTASPVRDEHLVGTIVEVRDVTAEQRAERSLRLNEERFRTFMTTSSSIVWMIDGEGALLDAPRWESFTGQSPEEARGWGWLNCIHPDDQEAVRRVWRRTVEGKTPAEFGYRLRHHAGEYRYVRVAAAPLLDGRGEVREWVGTITDVHERQQVEETRARLAAIVASSDDAIVGKDLDGIIQSWNQGAERLFGYSAEEAVGQSITLIIPPERLAEEDEILARLRRGERVDHFETVRRHKDGSLRDVSLTISPIVDGQGHIVGASKIARDIGERRRIEVARKQRELEQALDAQSEAQRRQLGRELHDGLRQELVGIHMLASSLSKKLAARAAPEAALMQDFAELVRDANDELRRLINGLVPVKIEGESLLPALERAAANLEQWYGLPCQVICRDQVALPDDAQAQHLFHIAQEAMTNAAKHAKASQIEVCLKVAGETLTLEVHDDGVGLPEDFEKRGGLGISSLRSRAELIGARLDFRSDPGRGTRVSCSLSF